MIEAKDIKQQAIGHWNTITLALAPQLTQATEKIGKHTPCPVHGGKDGFRLFKDFQVTGGGICNTCGEFTDGFSLLQWANSWSFSEALKATSEYLNGKPIFTTNDKVDSKAKQSKELRNQKKINEVLAQCQRMSWPLANYLKNRGLSALEGRVPKDLMAVERLPYWEDVDGTYQQQGIYPAMTGIVRNLSGNVITLHRTYLSTTGEKANIPNPKKIMPPAVQGASSGCAIQLFEATENLAITEGIETALAVHLSTGLPVWAAISSTMLEQVKIPASVKNVFIMADKDRSGAGLKAAEALAKRIAHQHNTKVIVPNEAIPEGAKSIDWLDVYLNEIHAQDKPLSDGGDHEYR